MDRFVSTDPYIMEQKSPKLAAKRIGPFRITKLVGRNAVKLELPLMSRAHPLINVSSTTPYQVQPSDISFRNLKYPLPYSYPPENNSTSNAF